MEGKHASVASETEHVDDLLQVESHGCAVLRRDRFEGGFLEVEDLGIVLSVLQRVLSIIAGTDLYLTQYGYVDL